MVIKTNPFEELFLKIQNADPLLLTATLRATISICLFSFWLLRRGKH